MPGSGERDDHLALLLRRIQADDLTSYRRVSGPDELAQLVTDDVSMVLMEAFTGAAPSGTPTAAATAHRAPARARASRRRGTGSSAASSRRTRCAASSPDPRACSR